MVTATTEKLIDDTVASELSRREMLSQVRQLCEPDNVTNWRVLILEYATFAALTAICLVTYQWIVTSGWSRWWILPVYLPIAFLIGIGPQNRLSCLVHESSHFLLFKNRVLNDVMANLFVCFPFFAKISNYRAGHWGHHNHVNDPENDPDLKRLSRHQKRDFPVNRWRFLWEYLFLQMMPHKAFSYLKGRAEYVMFLKQGGADVEKNQPIKQPWMFLLRFGYYLTLAAVLTIFGWWPHYLLFWIVPLVTVYPAALFVREIAHHGNYPDNGDYTNSRVYAGYWWEREVFFPYGEWNHVLHHLYPRVPWHKMRQAHETMMHFPPYRDNVVLCDGFLVKGRLSPEFPTVLDVLANPSRTYLRSASTPAEALDELRSESAVDANDRKVMVGMMPGES
jgi:fatty acid desaturase